MLVFVALFEDLKDSFSLGGKALEEASSVFENLNDNLRHVKGAVAYHAGRDGAEKPAVALAVREAMIKDDKVVLYFGDAKTLDVNSGSVGGDIYRLASQTGRLNKKGHAPLLYFLPRADFDMMRQRIKLGEQAAALMAAKDYKGVCKLLGPLGKVRGNTVVWDSAELLYKLGLSCSKLSVTLQIKAGETERLKAAQRFRDYCVAFLRQGAALEPGSARCATALAYRYYSNVHELMRPGERRDQDLSEQIDHAHEWLSRALEIYPESIRNHYRKGKLIIEKQAPYLLFGQHTFGSREAELLREIREVGEEHLATAISLYEALGDEAERGRNRREYAKALFVLGGYYLDDAYLPMHEYYLSVVAQKTAPGALPAIVKLDLQSAVEHLEKCFCAETDMALDKLAPQTLSALHKEWTRSPVEKLYRLGCAHSALSFVARMQGCGGELKTHAQKAAYYLEAAAKTALQSRDRKRNTWHISEKLAWTHMHAGEYQKAAALLARAKQGYLCNTRAVALLLCGEEAKAKEALESAAKDRHNLAAGLTDVLLAYVTNGPLRQKTLSARNRRLARILGLPAD